MKQFFLSTILLFVAFSTLSAQEYKKQLKSANKTLSKYYLDPVANKAELTTALASIDAIFAADDAKADPEAWITKGQIFNEIAKSEMNKKVLEEQLGNKMELNTPNAGMIALEAFEKAISMAVKKSQTADALSGVRENEDFLNNIGITYFQVNDYNNAFKNFNAAIKGHDMLKAGKQTSRLDDVTIKNDHFFYTAAAGYLGDYKTEANVLFEKLSAADYPQALVYEALFTATAEKDEAKAMEILEKGRKLLPDDNSLLFAEINHYLKVGKLNILTDKLKAAIAKEPNNISVYTTLGNVYDQLNQKERGEGNMAKADEYFGLAYDYYKQALEKDPKSFDAVYSQGALYYNKAASMTSKLNELGNDYSSAGTKKYNAIKAEMDGYFKEALPYFLKAEGLNPKDLNTMIALKEIYAREGNLEKSGEYKGKIDALSGN
jgi:Flp pilus assembly protein TadD